MSKRSIILDGMVTSISMEDAFWAELDRAAREHHLSWADYVRDMLRSIPLSANRSGAIREAVLRGVRAQVESGAGGYPSTWQVHERGSFESRVVTTTSPRILVGRSEECVIQIDDPEASRRHGLFVNDGTDWWVLDLDSKNGITVGGVRTRSARVGLGMRVTAGQSTIVRVG